MNNASGKDQTWREACRRSLSLATLALLIMLGMPQGNALAQMARGDAAMKAKDYDGALEAYKQALTSDPSNARARFQMCWIHNERKQYALAVSQLLEAQRLNATNDVYTYELADRKSTRLNSSHRT